MSTVVGTNHFISLEKAVIYYSLYGFPREEVEHKLTDGEIAIGVPVVNRGEKVLLDSDGRYHILTRN